MLGRLFSAATASSSVVWIVACLLAVRAVFAACIVITMRTALRAESPATREIAYRMFRDLLALFAPRRRG